MIVDEGSAAHYMWGPGCEGWHFLRRNDLSLIKERVPPGCAEKRHRHRKARQFFYILAGEAEIEVEGGIHRLRAGQGLEVAPGSAHRFGNPFPAAVEFLVVSMPMSHGDREDME
jgi:mannose-6-phosphate isomerase-like protein (cupin superfamily)